MKGVNGFLTALGDLPVTEPPESVGGLLGLWNREMNQAADIITAEHPLPFNKAKQTPWFSGELRVGQWLERYWQ